MIELYTGTPGSGKSLHAVRTIRDYLKWKKRDVIANFEVVTDESWKGHFTYMPNNELSPGNLISFAVDYWKGRRFKEDGILIVIDEAQILFNSRRWQDKDRMSWLTLMSQNRKYGMRIILVTQADIMIDRQFRSLVEYETKHRKLGNLGKFGMIVKVLCLGQELFFAITKYYGMQMVTGRETFRYSKKLGSMYNSYTAFQKESGTADAVTLPSETCYDTDIMKSWNDGKDHVMPSTQW